MQVTVDSRDSLDNTLRVVGALYGVELAVASGKEGTGTANGSGRAEQAPSSGRRSRSGGGGRSRRGGTGRSSSSPDLAAVRAWAREQGYDVSDRGRVPNTILAAYQESVASA